VIKKEISLREKINKIPIFEPGTIIQFSYGAYSNYEVIDTLIVIKEIDMSKVTQQFYNDTKYFNKYSKTWNITENDFVTYVVINEYAVPLNYHECHLGDYSDSFMKKWQIKEDNIIKEQSSE